MGMRTFKKVLKPGFIGAAVILLMLCISLPVQAALTDAQQAQIQAAIDAAITAGEDEAGLSSIIDGLLADPANAGLAAGDILDAALAAVENNQNFTGSLGAVLNNVTGNVPDNYTYNPTSGDPLTYTPTGGGTPPPPPPPNPITPGDTPCSNC